MPEPNKFSLKESALADGTIDFYAMLNEPEDAPADQIKAKINSLYSESQANRDHRNLTKRREYQTLLELLPGARAALLDADKRQRYDAYLAAARAGTNTPDFESFMNDLMGLNETMEERTGLLGVQDNKPTEVRARVIKAPVQGTTPKQAPVAVPSKSPGIPPAAIGGGVGGLIVGIVIGLAIHKLIPGILIGVILGAILFVVLNKKPGGKVGL
jgi:hypothetical protein